MKIAVVGAGIFGCVIAADLAKAGAQVTLYEQRADILDGSSARNPARLHHGYHYPRSLSTAREAKNNFLLFKTRFPEAVYSVDHFYVLAKESKVTRGEYIAFMDSLQLPFLECTVESLPKVHTAEAVFRVHEGFIDVNELRRCLRRELAASNVEVITEKLVFMDSVPNHDYTIWCTYGVPWLEPLRFEVCETAIVELGRYGRQSFVIIDGEFGCLDPRPGRTFTMYDVAHSVHHVSEGCWPDVPAEYQELIRRPGIIQSPLTNYNLMTDSLSRFLWGLRPDGQHSVIYHGSMWALRAVLPNVDDTDARPTLVQQQFGTNVIRVLAGKMCSVLKASAVVRSYTVDAE